MKLGERESILWGYNIPYNQGEEIKEEREGVG